MPYARLSFLSRHVHPQRHTYLNIKTQNQEHTQKCMSERRSVLSVGCFFFTVSYETVHSSNSAKGRLHSCEEINAGTIQSDTHVSVDICEPSIAHQRSPGQPVNHRPPLSQGTREKSEDGVKEKEMGLDGWVKLSEITTEPLQQVENTTRISRALQCMAESWPQLCSLWVESLNFTSARFISVSKYF